MKSAKSTQRARDEDGDGGVMRCVALALRARRRALRLDQRALAAEAGVSKSTVARIELGDERVALATLRPVLAAAGLALVVAHAEGVRWHEDETLPGDALGAADRAQRRLPAHLPAAPTDGLRSWDFSRGDRWRPASGIRWRYDRWSDDVDALVAEVTSGPGPEGCSPSSDEVEPGRNAMEAPDG